MAIIIKRPDYPSSNSCLRPDILERSDRILARANNYFFFPTQLKESTKHWIKPTLPSTLTFRHAVTFDRLLSYKSLLLHDKCVQIARRRTARVYPQQQRNVESKVVSCRMTATRQTRQYRALQQTCPSDEQSTVYHIDMSTA